jgi:hypothetical protein
MRLSRRSFVATGCAGLAAAGAAMVPATEAGEVFTPEMFGAKGDGVTNDTAALAALSRHVSQRGGGIVRFRPVTYLLGAQERPADPSDGWTLRPASGMSFMGCRLPLRIEGNGAKLRCAPGLRFGTFDRGSLEPSKRPMPNLSGREMAAIYEAMILVQGATAPVTISDFELDGNLSKLRIGGPYGDSGWQLPGSGLVLKGNRGDETIRNVYTHHHPQDGIMIQGIADAELGRRVRRRIDNLRSEYNGRQGCSIVGGRGYAFANCKFNHTGRGGIASAPGAGVDIEAEDDVNRDLTFTDCEFVDNVGCGLLADSGDSEDVTVVRCKLVGTTSWSAWPFKPRMRFHDCTFVGALVRCYGDKDPERAVQFHNCRFFDDPALSPTGAVYLPDRPYGTIADLNFGTNALFKDCRFKLTGGGLLPWSWRAIYIDCTLEQKAPVASFPKGQYLGHSVIRGSVDMYGAKIDGTLDLNGKILTHTQLGGDPW